MLRVRERWRTTRVAVVGRLGGTARVKQLRAFTLYGAAHYRVLACTLQLILSSLLRGCANSAHRTECAKRFSPRAQREQAEISRQTLQLAFT